MPENPLERLGESRTIAGFARVVTIVVSVVGPPLLGFGGYVFHRFESGYETQAATLSRIDIFLAGAAERAAERDRRIVALEGDNKDQGRVLYDHERRLTTLEARR